MEKPSLLLNFMLIVISDRLTIIKEEEVIPMFEYFPENYTWTLAVMNNISFGSNISEVDEACRPLKEYAKMGVDPVAQEAWYESWKKLAERVEKLAMEDEAAGHPLSAGRKYERASMYYMTAERMMTNRDERKLQTYKQMIHAFRKGMELRGVPMEFIDIPYEESSIPAFFLPAFGKGKAPCMIYMGGFDSIKETYNYFRIRDEFRIRGISLLGVDQPGVGGALRLNNLPARYDTEVPVAACVDYLKTRSDVDSERIGIMALSLGGYYAPRAAAFEKRLACCVAWGALYDYGKLWRERQKKYSSVPGFQLTWVTGKDTEEEALKVIDKFTLEGVVDKITCPILVVHGENDRQVPVSHAARIIAEAVNSSRAELKIHTLAEWGNEHCSVDNVSMGVDYIADWVAEVLGGDNKGVKHSLK